MAAAGIAVVTLPQTNLFLQARGWATAPPRGLTALRPPARRRRHGGRRRRQPAGPVQPRRPGRPAGDQRPAGDGRPPLARRSRSTPCRPPAGPRSAWRRWPSPPGRPAELMAVPAPPAVREAIATAAGRRVVIHRGQVVRGVTGRRVAWPAAGPSSPAAPGASASASPSGSWPRARRWPSSTVRAEEVKAAAAALDGAAPSWPTWPTPPRPAAAVGDAAEALGGLDILVNNAGILHMAPLLEIDVDDWDRTFDVNVRSMLLHDPGGGAVHAGRRRREDREHGQHGRQARGARARPTTARRRRP